MADRRIVVELPEDLVTEASEIATMQGLSLADLVAEALGEAVERNQRTGWLAERTAPSTRRREKRYPIN